MSRANAFAPAAMTPPYFGWRLEVADYDTSKGQLSFNAVRGSERHMLDWSSYRHYEQECFEMMVDMAFPTRQAMPEGYRTSPLWPHDVRELHADWLDAIDDEPEHVGSDDYSDLCESEPPLSMAEIHQMVWAEHQEAHR